MTELYLQDWELPKASERFFRRVSGDSFKCWESFYPYFSMGGKTFKVAEAAWFFTYSEWPKEPIVRICRRVNCCNPRHLCAKSKYEKNKEFMDFFIGESGYGVYHKRKILDAFLRTTGKRYTIQTFQEERERNDIGLKAGSLCRNKKDLVINIKSLDASKIFKGEKTVAFRKTLRECPPRPLAYIYVGNPVMAIVGVMEIDQIEHLSVSEMQQKSLTKAAMSLSDFHAYFQDQRQGCAISIARALRFSRPCTN